MTSRHPNTFPEHINDLAEERVMESAIRLTQGLEATPDLIPGLKASIGRQHLSRFVYAASMAAAAAVLALLLFVDWQPGSQWSAPLGTKNNGPSDNTDDKGRGDAKRFLSAPPKTLDPALAGDVVSSAQAGMAYEGLLEYDYFNPSSLQPCLAAELPVISEDGLTWTFTLRNDVYFHDDACFEGGKGRRMTASDVRYSILRFGVNPSTPGFWVVEGKISGLNDLREKTRTSLFGYRDPIQRTPTEIMKAVDEAAATDNTVGIKVEDDFTLRIHLTAPNPLFSYELAMSYFHVVPREAVRHYGERFGSVAVGTGPFVLKTNTDDGLLWERNPRYRDVRFPMLANDDAKTLGLDTAKAKAFQELAGRRLPLIKSVEFQMIRESKDAWAAFKEGKIDTSGMEADQFAEAIKDGALTEDFTKLGVQLVSYPRPSVEYIAMNMDDPVVGTKAGMKGRALRRAIGYGMDRQHYIDTYLNGRGVVAANLVGANVQGGAARAWGPMCDFNAELARIELKNAGYSLKMSENGTWIARDENGEQPKVEILCRGTSMTSQDMSAFLTAIGPKIGINIVAPCIEFRDFLRRQDEGNGQAYNAGWVMDYPHPFNIFMLLHSGNAKVYGVNSARYRNEKLDAILTEMQGMDTMSIPKMMEKKVQDALDILGDDCPWLLVYHRKQILLHQAWVAPVVPNDFAYNSFKYLHVDNALRSKMLKGPTEK